MELTLLRKVRTKNSTIGELLIDNKFFCYTLEDMDRQLVDGNIIKWSSRIKKYGATAIPYGRYEVIINFSNRFQQPMPLLLNVPDYLGIRIHAGNTDKNTEGCLLVGFTKSVDFIGNSRSAYKSLFPIIREALKTGKVNIGIERG
jgi:hypothetical protein